MKETKPITTHNLYDFCINIQDAVTEGYRLSVENEHFPVQLGPSLYICVMVREEETKAKPEVLPTKEGAEDKPKGRTRKVK